MPRNTVPLAILAFTLVVVLAAMFITSQQLPARVASHFNAAGVPDGWTTRSAYMWSMIGMTLGLPAFLLALFGITRNFPDSMINLPNRDYWLAPERRQDTHDSIFRYGIWLAILITALFLGIHLSIVAANSAQPPNLSHGVWLILGAFFLFMSLWTFFLIRQFLWTK
jgi:serine/threonine-protein kinase